jgi:fused signal recognition particle receptor
MFGSLKEKLKNWVSKNEEEEIVEEKPKKITKKKEVKPKKTKTTKKEKPKKEEPKEKKSIFSKLKKETKEEAIEEPEEKKSFLSKFQKELTEEEFDELFEELQIILLQNNCAYETVEAIEKSLKESLVGKPLKDVDLSSELKKSIQDLLISPPNFLEQIKAVTGKRSPESGQRPFVILFSGINGSGKTTTIAKVANYLQKNSLTVCLAAADTFRAAAIQQLEVHGQNLKVPVIKKDYGSDPAAVGFDAVKYATKNSIDVVLIDTAGRMQNKDSLMKEIEKISRVTKPNMKIFLGESITGNDATQQAKAFNESIELTGIILSKADVDEKGGTALSVSHVTGKPILFLGTGQDYQDLEIFDKVRLIEKLGL